MSDKPAFLNIPRRPPRASDNPRTITKTMRTRVLERDDFKCRRCGNGPSETALCVDHVVPVSKGGLATFDNLQTLCQPCNAGKSNSDPHPHDRKGTKASTASATAWPCGQFFLTGAPRHWQGIVERIPSEGVIVVQLFSWLTGARHEPSSRPAGRDRGGGVALLHRGERVQGRRRSVTRSVSARRVGEIPERPSVREASALQGPASAVDQTSTFEVALDDLRLFCVAFARC